MRERERETLDVSALESYRSKSISSLCGGGVWERRCWELEMRLQKKDVQKFTKKKRDRLKAVYIREKRR